MDVLSGTYAEMRYVEQYENHECYNGRYLTRADRGMVIKWPAAFLRLFRHACTSSLFTRFIRIRVSFLQLVWIQKLEG